MRAKADKAYLKDDRDAVFDKAFHEVPQLVQEGETGKQLGAVQSQMIRVPFVVHCSRNGCSRTECGVGKGQQISKPSYGNQLCSLVRADSRRLLDFFFTSFLSSH